MIRGIFIGAGTTLAVGCAVLALAKAAALVDQRRDRLLRDLHQRHTSEVGSAPASGTVREAGSTAPASVSGATDSVLAVAPDQPARGRGGDADEVMQDRVTPAEVEVEAHAATAGEPTRTDLLLTAIDRLRARVERAEEQRAAAEARYTRLAAAVTEFLTIQANSSWGEHEAAVRRLREMLGEVGE